MSLPSLVQMVRAAVACPGIPELADSALALVQSYHASGRTTRLPGFGTFERLAVRIHRGASVEEAAAREYAYRWHLPLNQWINHAEARARSMPVTGAWPVPHAIGMDGVE